MGIYLLKFTACLFVLWLLYVLFLERENMHHFKRFYLIFSIIASATIPLLSITYYVDPKPNEEAINAAHLILESGKVAENVVSIGLLELLWIIYGIGVLCFTFRFFSNLKQIYSRIQDNDRIKRNPFTYILLKQDVNPHTFFKLHLF